MGMETYDEYRIVDGRRDCWSRNLLSRGCRGNRKDWRDDVDKAMKCGALLEGE
jgi:hypothetical protein